MLVTPKGQRPVILVEQRQKCFYQVQRTVILLPVLTECRQILRRLYPYRAFILFPTLGQKRHFSKNDFHITQVLVNFNKKAAILYP